MLFSSSLMVLPHAFPGMFGDDKLGGAEFFSRQRRDVVAMLPLRPRTHPRQRLGPGRINPQVLGIGGK